jgi:hypothetical protein
MWTRALSLFMLVAASACGSDVDDRPVSFSYIHAAILVPNCATSGCHSTLTKTKNVDMESRDAAYATFYDEDSNIVAILNGTASRTVSMFRMPIDQPLPDADIDLIDRWVKAGKPNN